MNAKILMKMLLFLSIFSTVGHANSIPSQDTLDAIFEHAQNAIKHVEEDKIYLDPERVHLHEGIIFIEGEDHIAISIPSICSNEFGLFLAGNPEARMIPVWICANSHCQQKYYYEPTRCLNCQCTSFRVRYEVPQ